MAAIGASQQPQAWAGSSEDVDDQEHRGFLALLYPEESWLAFALLATMFLVVVWTVEGSKWVREMPGLTGMALGALLTGYVLARIRVPAVLLQPVGLIIGAQVILWQTINTASGGSLEERIIDAAVRLYSFAEVVRGGGISTDGLPFVVQVLLLTWFIGYFSAWFLYRNHNVWLTILPAGAALMVNLTYVPGRFVVNFVIFIVAALLLVMLIHGVEQHRRWRRSNVPLEEIVHLSYVGPVLLFGSVLLLVSFWLPLLEQSTPASAFWERATGPWRVFEREFDRLFASVSSGKVSPLHSFGRAMPFRGAVNFGDQLPLAGRLGFARDVVGYIQAEEAGYWRAESYDTYTSQGWIASERLTRSLPQDPVAGAMEEYRARRAVNQSVEVVAPMDVLIARGLPIYGSIPANGEIGQPATFSLNLSDLSKNRGLSPELQNAAAELSRNLRSSGRLVAPGEMQRLLPADLRPRGTSRRGAEIETLELARTDPFPLDFTSIRTITPLARGQKYTIASAVSTATADQLQAAGTSYVGWVKDQYLQVPGSLPERVKALAVEWTSDARTPYDKAVAIESRLRAIEYSTNVTPPPRGSDGVDHFLFTLKRGYADYHAAAMTVMLRTLGVPARVSVGYVAGEWDSEQERFTVREAHAHAWPEVFFPSYGWIEFSPTPNWPLMGRLTNTEGGSGEEEDLLDPNMASVEDDVPPEGSGLGSASTSGLVDLSEILRPTLVVLGVLAALALALRLLWLSGLSGLSLPAQTYEKMCRLAELARLGPRLEQTPSEYAQRLVVALPAAQGSIQEIARRYATTVYGNFQPSPAEMQRLRDAWNALRWPMVLKVLRWRDRQR